MFVVYETETTKLHKEGGFIKYYETERGAKGVATRKAKADGGNYAVADSETFYGQIEKKRQVQNLMTGDWVEEGINTPVYMSVACESYWSM